MRLEPAALEKPSHQFDEYAEFLESKSSLELFSKFRVSINSIVGSISSDEMDRRKKVQMVLETWPQFTKTSDSARVSISPVFETTLFKFFVVQTSRLFDEAYVDKEVGLEKVRDSNGLIDVNKLKGALAEITQKIDNAGSKALADRQASSNKRGGLLADSFYSLLDLLLTSDLNTANRDKNAAIVTGLRVAFQEAEDDNEGLLAKRDSGADFIFLPWSKGPIDLRALSDKEREYVWLWNKMLLVLLTKLLEEPEVFLGYIATFILAFLEDDEGDGTIIPLSELCNRKGIEMNGATDEELSIRLLESLSSNVRDLSLTAFIGGALGIATQVWLVFTLSSWLFSLFNGDGGASGDVAMTAADLASFSGNTPTEAPGLFSGGLELLKKLIGGGSGGQNVGF